MILENKRKLVFTARIVMKEQKGTHSVGAGLTILFPAETARNTLKFDGIEKRCERLL